MKKVFLVAASALAIAACHDNPVGPSANTVVIIAPQSIITVNGSAQLAATVYDNGGKIVPNASVTWKSLNPTVASVSATGLVTGLSVGSVTIRASSGSASGEVQITVDPDPCTTPLSLSVGQVRQVSGPAAVACITLAATTGSTDYLFVTANATPAMDDIAQYSVSASVQGTSASIGSGQSLTSPLASLASAQAPDYRSAVEANIRRQERPLVAQLATARRAALLNVVPSAPAAASAPTEGSTVTYHVPNVNAGDLCTSYVDVQAEVKKVSAHAVIVQDVNAPANGFTAQDFSDIAAEWESLIFPTDTLYFGGPTDRNADGHVTILYTNEVNRATSSGSSSFIAGFFWGGDLVKKTEYQQIGKSCPQTNEQEIFYMLVPDPTGTINGNPRSNTLVRQNTRGTLAHEFQHMINQGLRLLNPAVDSSETVWLNESLSHFAEEIVGRAFKGFGDFQNLTFANVNPNLANQDDYQAFFRQNLTRLRPWQQRPDTASPISNKARNQLAPRGAGWMFVRYLTDQYSGGNAKAYLRHIVAGPDIGIRNLVQWSNAQFDDMLRGFLVSQFADEMNISGLSALYTVPSWNMRDVMSGVNSGVYPLQVTALPTAVSTQSVSGSGNYFRLTRSSASPATTFRMVGPGGTQLTNQGVRVYVLRVN